MRTRVFLAASLLSSCFALPACGSDEDDDRGSSADAGPDAGGGEIEILVDQHGVPHIYANTDEDLFYGYGYQLATDRLYQLEMFRRSAIGRRAEILGADEPGAIVETALFEDRLLRMLDIERWARADMEVTQTEDPERHGLLMAWKDGINARIQEVLDGSAPLPWGFGAEEHDFTPEPWRDVDPYINMKMARFVMDQTLLFEILVTVVTTLNPDIIGQAEIFEPVHPTFSVPPEERPVANTRTAFLDPGSALFPNGSPPAEWVDQLPELVQYLEVFQQKNGSNNWAVHGSHTDNGRPMIAGDPHLPFNASGVPYALHLSSKHAGASGTFDVIGFSFASTPGILAGHNDKVMWTPTSAFADVMDMWEVVVTDTDVTVAGDTVPLEIREESIPVRGADPFPNTYRDVPGYGVIFDPGNANVPIPIAQTGREILLNWTGLSGGRPGWFLEVNRAESVADFEASVERAPDLNFMYVAADATDITLKNGVMVPKRAPIEPNREPWRSMDGDDPDAYWPGDRLSFDELPHGHGPNQGFVFSANNDPLGFSSDGNASNDAYFYGAFFDPGWRAHRIESELTRLTGRGGITLEEMQALQMDVNSNVADDMIPLVTAAWAAVGTDPALAEYEGRTDLETLVTALEGWDRRMVRDASEPVISHALAHHLTLEVYLDEPAMSLVYDRILDAATFFGFKLAVMALRGDYARGDEILQGGRDLTILRALDATAQYLVDRFGSSDPSAYTYGDIHQTNFDGSYGIGLDIATDPTDGGDTSINVTQNSTFLETTPDTRSQMWTSKYGPVERTVGRIQEDGTPEVYVNLPVGNVADPTSPHFRDGFEGWRDGDYIRLPYTRQEVEESVESRLTVLRR